MPCERWARAPRGGRRAAAPGEGQPPRSEAEGGSAPRRAGRRHSTAAPPKPASSLGARDVRQLDADQQHCHAMTMKATLVPPKSCIATKRAAAARPGGLRERRAASAQRSRREPVTSASVISKTCKLLLVLNVQRCISISLCAMPVLWQTERCGIDTGAA